MRLWSPATFLMMRVCRRRGFRYRSAAIRHTFIFPIPCSTTIRRRDTRRLPDFCRAVNRPFGGRRRVVRSPNPSRPEEAVLRLVRVRVRSGCHGSLTTSPGPHPVAGGSRIGDTRTATRRLAPLPRGGARRGTAYQSLPIGRPSSGVRARTQVACEMPPLTSRTLPSASPTKTDEGWLELVEQRWFRSAEPGRIWIEYQ